MEFPSSCKSTFNSASYIQVSVLIQSPDVSGSHPSRFPIYCFCRFIRFVEVTHENMASVHHNLKHKIIIRVKTRMHSKRMRTARCWPYPVVLRGVLPNTLMHTPLPPWTEWHTRVKRLSCPKLRLRAVVTDIKFREYKSLTSMVTHHGSSLFVRVDKRRQRVTSMSRRIIESLTIVLNITAKTMRGSKFRSLKIELNWTP